MASSGHTNFDQSLYPPYSNNRIRKTHFSGFLRCLVITSNVRFILLQWENAVDLLKMYRVILSSVSEEFRRKMTVLLDISDKDPLHSHCYHVNDCQKSNFANKRRSAFLY